MSPLPDESMVCGVLQGISRPGSLDFAGETNASVTDAMGFAFKTSAETFSAMIKTTFDNHF